MTVFFFLCFLIPFIAFIGAVVVELSYRAKARAVVPALSDAQCVAILDDVVMSSPHRWGSSCPSTLTPGLYRHSPFISFSLTSTITLNRPFAIYAAEQPDSIFYLAEMDEYLEPAIRQGAMGGRPGGGYAWRYSRDRAVGWRKAHRAVDMTIMPNSRTLTTMASDIVKGEQEEAMWATRSDVIDAESLLHQGQHPFEFLCDICGSNACSCEEDLFILLSE